MSDLGRDMDIPFHDQDVTSENPHWAGGVFVMAGSVDVPGVGLKPVLVFRFAKPHGGFYDDIALVADPDQIAGLKTLVNQAANRAIREVTK